MKRFSLLVAMLLPCAAQAEPDRFAVGTGRDGPLTAAVGQTVVNAVAEIAADVLAGSSSVTIANERGGSVTAGDLVMLLVSRGLDPAPAPGAQAAIDVTNGMLGVYELARVLSRTSDVLTLSAPISRTFSATRTQLIRVREYSAVTLPNGAKLTPAPWDGKTGGVVAILCSGVIQTTAGGGIDVNFGGYSGGAASEQAPAGAACTLGDGAASAGYASKGEGAATDSSAFGANNWANGGGGGNCVAAGGGGGAGAGSGGGGATGSNATLAGRGGAAIVAPASRLLFGGGGGAGHGDTSTAATPGPGGAGGGIIFVRAQSLSGASAFLASGNPPSIANPGDGGGGGGGGGTVHVRVIDSLDCGAGPVFSANGGNGRVAVSGSLGGGGGGGGGRVLIEGPDAMSCTPGNVFPGMSVGSPGALGVAVRAIPTALTAPSLVPITTRSARPEFSGVADANARVVVLVDGRRIGEVVAAADGAYVLPAPADVPLGAHAAVAFVERDGMASAGSRVRTFFVGEECSGDDECASLDRGARCVAAHCGCMNASDCPSKRPICADGFCRPCANDCPSDLPVCLANGACAQCTSEAAAACTGATPFCAPSLSCVACVEDAHCAARPEGGVCLATEACGCRDDANCAPQSVCDAGKCVPGCRDDDGCSDGLVCVGEGIGTCSTPPTDLPLPKRGCAQGGDVWLWAMLLVRAARGRAR